MMNDLRALLGDRYASTLQAAVVADNPDAIRATPVPPAGWFTPRGRATDD